MSRSGVASKQKTLGTCSALRGTLCRSACQYGEYWLHLASRYRRFWLAPHARFIVLGALHSPHYGFGFSHRARSGNVASSIRYPAYESRFFNHPLSVRLTSDALSVTHSGGPMTAPEKAARVSQPRDYKLIVEKDVQIPLRDGTLLYADIFRPDGGAERFPGDHEHQRLPEGQAVGAAGGPRGEGQSLHELGDGQSRSGGARAATRCVRVDSRGSGKSPGKSEPSSYQESAGFLRRDRVDREAAVVLGNIGTLGISYHAAFAVARRQPAAAVAEVRSCRGKGARTSTATRPITAASSRWASSATGGSRTPRTICSGARAATTRTRSTTT